MHLFGRVGLRGQKNFTILNYTTSPDHMSAKKQQLEVQHSSELLFTKKEVSDNSALRDEM